MATVPLSIPPASPEILEASATPRWIARVRRGLLLLMLSAVATLASTCFVSDNRTLRGGRCMVLLVDLAHPAATWKSSAYR